MKTLTFYSTPGHGYLRVPRSMIERSGIADCISQFSTFSARYAYLEEDCDAPIALGTFADYKVKVVYSETFDHHKNAIGRFSGNPSSDKARALVTALMLRSEMEGLTDA